MNDVTLTELVGRLRAGDDSAAEQIVLEYEPQIRRLIRLRLTDHRLRRVVDSGDICQSVFGNFFARAFMGQFDLSQPAKLMALLSTMARNKLIERYRKEEVRKPPGAQVQYSELASDAVSRDPTPSTDLSLAELQQRVESCMSEKERKIATQRKLGVSWATIGESFGESKEAVRKQFERAMQRVLEELNLQ